MENKTEPPKALLWRWQHVIPIIILLGTTAWGFYAAYLHTQRSRLDFSDWTQITIANLKSARVPDLKLLYKEKTVDNAAVLSVTVENSGNVDLCTISQTASADIRNPRIRVEFPQSVSILDTFVEAQEPSTKIVRTDGAVTNSADFRIDLLNVGSSFRIDLVVAGLDRQDAKKILPLGLGLKARNVPADRRIHLSWWQGLLLVAVCIVLTGVIVPFFARVSHILVGVVPFAGRMSMLLLRLLDINIHHDERSDEETALLTLITIFLFFALTIAAFRFINFTYFNLW